MYQSQGLGKILITRPPCTDNGAPRTDNETLVYSLFYSAYTNNLFIGGLDWTELPHSVYACVFCIELRFTNTYLNCPNQGNYWEISIQ